MMAKDAVLEKVKHLSAQVAMDEQPSVILSQGFALCGQQSMSSMADISAISVDFTAAPTPPAARLPTRRSGALHDPNEIHG